MQISPTAIPEIDQRILRVFRWFVRWFVRRRFHALAVNSEALRGFDLRDDDALVLYANHASWWDPLTALLLADQFFPKLKLYAPIDAAMLAKYRMFARLGFFGVDQQRREGAIEFLKVSRRILSTPQSSIWITPEGRFADVRDVASPLSPGLGHLAALLARSKAESTDESSTAGVELKSSTPRVWFVPGAVEYVFWEEPRPEILCWFGEPVLVSPDAIRGSGSEPHSRRDDKLAWDKLLFERLRSAQAALAAASTSRDSSRFELLLGGSGGTFFIYDWWRKFSATVRGKSLRVEHSDKLRADD